MLQDMKLWTAVRHALFVEKISKRQAARRFGLDYRTIDKISKNESPGTYERAKASGIIRKKEGYKITENKPIPKSTKLE